MQRTSYQRVRTAALLPTLLSWSLPPQALLGVVNPPASPLFLVIGFCYASSPQRNQKNNFQNSCLTLYFLGLLKFLLAKISSISNITKMCLLWKIYL